MELNISNIFATRLRFARKVKKLSQEKLGILAGIDESSASARMNQYERGKHTPDVLMASQIAKILEVPLSFFYAPTDDLAELNRIFYNLDQAKKDELLSFAKQLGQNT